MMMPLTHTSPALIDEIILIDFVALFFGNRYGVDTLVPRQKVVSK